MKIQPPHYGAHLPDFQNKEARSWTMYIPNWHPTKLNKLLNSHYYVRNKLKNADYSMIWGYSLRNAIPKAEKKRTVEITITLAPKEHGGDPDAYFKVTCDALVNCGLLKNDSKEWVELLPVKYGRGKYKATSIKLVEVM